MSKDEKKHPCKYCSIRITYANNWDIHFSGEDCPYECERYEKWKAEQKEGDGNDKAHINEH